MNKEELKKRTKKYALDMVKAIDMLPNTAIGRTVQNQLIRCATSVAANYRAVCRARSTPEFIAKLGIVIEEADECEFWLEMIIEGGLLKKELISPLLIETNEIISIMVSSSNTAKRNNNKS